MRPARALGAAALALLGTNLVLLAVLGLNRPVPPPPPPKEVKEVSFQVAQRTKPPAPKAPAPPPRVAPRSATPPAALLGASLAGLSFGLDAFQDVVVDGSSALDGAGTGEVVMTEATVDVVPRPIHRVPPEYPVRARAKAIEGTVTLSVLVGEDGSVRDVAVLEATPAGVFEESARDAMRQWRFEPGMYQGRAVPVRVDQPLNFALE